MANSGRNLIWMGDLNCAPSNFDMSHMGFFKARKQVLNRAYTPTAF